MNPQNQYAIRPISGRQIRKNKQAEYKWRTAKIVAPANKVLSWLNDHIGGFSPPAVWEWPNKRAIWLVRAGATFRDDKELYRRDYYYREWHRRFSKRMKEQTPKQLENGGVEWVAKQCQ
jgi:hypothetical protein